MFICEFREKCIKDEKLAKKEYLGEVKGIKRFIRWLTWRPWNRESCDGEECRRYNAYCTERFGKFAETEAFKQLIEMEEKPYGSYD